MMRPVSYCRDNLRISVNRSTEAVNNTTLNMSTNVLLGKRWSSRCKRAARGEHYGGAQHNFINVKRAATKRC